MKKFKIMLSIFMVLVIITVSIVPTLAVNKVSTHQAIISEDLSYAMENSKPDEKIKVYLWYKDINQDKVDALTTEATGLTPEKCSVIEEFPSTETLYSLRNGDADAKTRINEYLKRTEPIREIERERTETYSQKHMEISNEKYNQKSRNIRESLSISDKDVEFSSQFAPMIIAEMTKAEIKNAIKNENIEEISLYKEEKMIEASIDSAMTTTRVDKINYGTSFGLTGEDIKVGLIEGDRVIFSTDGEEELSKLIYEHPDIDINTLERINIDQTTPTIITTNNNGTIRDYGNIAVVDGTPNPGGTHSTYMAKTIFSVAPNVKIYCTDGEIPNIETLVSAGVKVFNMSMGAPVFESDSKYAYTDREKWFDYLIANHGVTVFVAAGNNGNNSEDSYYFDKYGKKIYVFGPRVTSPGLAHNIITVGAYRDVLAYEDLAEGQVSPINVDTMISTSSYQNALDDKYGCEKPDVVAPDLFTPPNGGSGTSNSNAYLTSSVALICELKPSLANFPHLVKAIIMASCHRKVKQNTDGNTYFISGVQEYIEDGITERQGAGAPDAWNMACIVSQGTYGYGYFTAPETNINFVQPSYGATGLNISVAWLRENYVEDDSLQSVTSNDVIAVDAPNVNLSVYRNDTVIKTSTLPYSSTEMCYINELTDDTNYKIRLTQNYPPTTIRYAYAWSTNNMYAPISINQDSINYIRSASSGKYITYDTESLTPSAKTTTVSTQSALNNSHCWILQKNENAYNISTGYGSTKLYLGQSSTQTDSSYDSQLNTIAQNINIKYNGDGTVSFLNSTKDKILTVIINDTLVWNDFDEDISTPVLKQKWYLDKVNYLCGDANMDGDLEIGGYSENEVDEHGKPIALPGFDFLFVQDYLAKKVTMNNLQLFLADMDKNGVVDLFDTLLINQFAENKYY